MLKRQWQQDVGVRHGGRGHCIFHKVAGRHAEGAKKIERVERIVFDMLKMCVDDSFNASLRSKDISGLILLLPHLICIFSTILVSFCSFLCHRLNLTFLCVLCSIARKKKSNYP